MAGLGGFAAGLASGIAGGMKLGTMVREARDRDQLREDMKAINKTDQSEVRAPDQYSPEQRVQMDQQGNYYDEERGWLNGAGEQIQDLQAPAQVGATSYSLGGQTQDTRFSPEQVQNYRDDQMVRRLGEHDPMMGLQARRDLKQLRAADLQYKGAERADQIETKRAELHSVFQAAMTGNPEAQLKLARMGAAGFTSNRGPDGKHLNEDSVGVDAQGNFVFVGKDGSGRTFTQQDGYRLIGEKTGRNPFEVLFENALGAIDPDSYMKMQQLGDKRRDDARADRTQTETRRHNQAIEGIYSDRNRRGLGGGSPRRIDPVGMTDEGKFIVPDGKGGFTTQPVMIDGKPATPEQIRTFRKLNGGAQSVDPWETMVEMEREMPNGSRVKAKVPMRVADPEGYAASRRTAAYGDALDNAFAPGGLSPRSSISRGDELGIPR